MKGLCRGTILAVGAEQIQLMNGEKNYLVTCVDVERVGKCGHMDVPSATSAIFDSYTS